MSALCILKHSAHELIVHKPAGVASELPGTLDASSIKALVAQQFPGTQPRLPHRLDRVTSGILMVCLSAESIAFHNAQLKARRWEKYYLACVAAHPTRAPMSFFGLHKAFLVEEKGRARLVRAGGKVAWMEILTVESVPERADRWHVLIRLMTGRFHQIRVMCAALGLPLPGDPLYDEKVRPVNEFYLEHLVLKYTDFDTQAPATLYLHQHPARLALADNVQARILEIVARPGLLA